MLRNLHDATRGCPSIRLVPTSAPSPRGSFSVGKLVSVDQVGADVGTRLHRHRHGPGVVCPSIRLVPTSAPRRRLRLALRHIWCPSIRLVPTSAPRPWRSGPRTHRVSVDQVGADVGTLRNGLMLSQAFVSVDQVGADVGTRSTDVPVATITTCPSIRLVPTSAPHRSGWTGKLLAEVSVDQVGADVGTIEWPIEWPIAVKCPSIRLVPTSAPD